MSSFAKGNPFSLFFGDLFFWDLFFFFFFLFFLSPAKVGSLEMQPGAKLQAYLGVFILQPHACTQRFRLRILRRTRSNSAEAGHFSQPSQAAGVAHRLGRARLSEHCWRHPRRPLLQVSLDGFAASLQPRARCPGRGHLLRKHLSSEYKTSKSGGKSRLILPLTLPIFSLSGCHWFQNWLAARDRLGLPVQGAITPPLIHSLGAQGDTPRPFNTSEVNAILGKIAKPGEPVPTSQSRKERGPGPSAPPFSIVAPGCWEA